MPFQSPPFYSHRNGYKMCLGFSAIGVGHSARFSIHLHIMRGEFDNILQWPFRHMITLDLMNEETGLPYLSGFVNALQYPKNAAWRKPINDQNDGITLLFIWLSDIFLIPCLRKDNQIWIKVTPKML